MTAHSGIAARVEEREAYLHPRPTPPAPVPASWYRVIPLVQA